MSRATAILLLAASLFSAPAPAHAQGGARPEVVVSPRGPVRTIAAAIAAAPSGGRVRVQAGLYREPTIIVEKPVEIVGDKGAILDGEGKRQLITVRANDVTIRGLTLRNVGTSYVEDRAAIKVQNGRNCVITDNRIERGFFGIYLSAVEGCRIERNWITAVRADEAGSGNGVHLWSSNNVLVADNHISGHRDGIYFEFVHDSEVRGNTSEANLRYGLHFMYSDDCRYVSNTFRNNLAGVAVMYTKGVEMSHNRFEENWGSASYGLLLKEIYDAKLVGNRFARNTVGLFADGANRLEVTGNQFLDNGWAVKLMASTEASRFERNNFAGNTFDLSTNSRQSEAVFRGNYWDEYKGYDLNRDGVGDVPHRPVRLYSLVVERNTPAMILLRSTFVGMLDAAERIIPALTPAALADEQPAMRRLP